MCLSLKDKKLINQQLGISDGDQLEIGCKIKVAEAKNLINSKILNKKLFKTTTAKGRALEDVVNYFLEKCGMFSHVRTDHRSSVHQIDHHAMFRSNAQRIFFKLHSNGRALVLGESKNYSRHGKLLGVDVVYKVEGIKSRVGYSLGIYFTRGGVTGDEYKAATKLAYDFCNANNNVSVVFNDDDWKFLAKSPKLFQRLLFEKIEHFIVNNNFKIKHSKVKDWGK